MKQEIIFTLQIILFGLVALTGVAILIFVLRRKCLYDTIRIFCYVIQWFDQYKRCL